MWHLVNIFLSTRSFDDITNNFLYFLLLKSNPSNTETYVQANLDMDSECKKLSDGVSCVLFWQFVAVCLVAMRGQHSSSKRGRSSL